MKHIGLSVHRLRDNPTERLFAEQWAKDAPRWLGHLIGTHDDPDNYSQRDATVAATIIQWLGSPVGDSFVREVHARIEDGRSNGKKR